MFVVGLVLLAILGYGGTLYFTLARNVQEKRHWHAPWRWATAAVFVLLPAADGAWWASALIAIPAVAMAVRFITVTQFCDRCGAMTVDGFIGKPTGVCVRCGAPLHEAPAPAA